MSDQRDQLTTKGCKKASRDAATPQRAQKTHGRPSPQANASKPYGALYFTKARKRNDDAHQILLHLLLPYYYVSTSLSSG